MDKPNVPSAIPDCEIRTVQIRCLPLPRYMRHIQVLRQITPVGSSTGVSKNVLTEDVKQLLVRILALMPDPECKKRRCMYKLTPENIMVNLEDGRPFLDRVYWTRYSAFVAKKNYSDLAQIISDVVMNGVSPADWPQDFTELVMLMSTGGHSSSYLLKHGSPLASNINKRELVMRLHGQLHDVLRHKELQHYHEVLASLVFPKDWDQRADRNKHMKKIYNFKGSKYEPNGINPAGEVVRYDRNSFTHGLERSVDPITLEQEFDQEDLAQMLEAELEMLIWSLQLALHKKGYLKNCKVESLFR